MDDLVKNETKKKVYSGWVILGIMLLEVIIAIAFLLLALFVGNSPAAIGILWTLFGLVLLATVFESFGIHVNMPNNAIIYNFFGKYAGTTDRTGLLFVNPLLIRDVISLRLNNLTSDIIKVNDKIGNPIEIGAVAVWHIGDTYKAVYDVVSYQKYIGVQFESAIRNLANEYTYDFNETGEKELTLRGNALEISEILVKELQERVDKAGIIIDETRIAHIAYAAEIAAVMLQRQQASAIVDARKTIVEGAVTIVQMAVDKLSKNSDTKISGERKAAMIANLMVVMCSDRAATPIIDTSNK